MGNMVNETVTIKMAEAASMVGVSIPTIMKWMQRDDFPAFRSGKKWIIPRDPFMKWLETMARKHEQL